LRLVTPVIGDRPTAFCIIGLRVYHFRRSQAVAVSFVAELRRRNVLRVGAAYVAGAWLLVQVAQTLLPAFGFGHEALRVVVLVLAIGLLPLLIVAWAFELTAEGLKRESDVDRHPSLAARTSQSLDRVIMVMLALALSYFAFDRFVLAPGRTAEQTEAAREERRVEASLESYGEKSIAVLPFADMSPGKDQEYFSDGIAEELLNLLARVPELRVISRSSAFSYRGRQVTAAQVAEDLRVTHVLDGSVRKSGRKVRIAVQLIDARSDTQLWSQTWDRDLDDIFAVQDEIAAAVVSQLRLTLLGAAPKAGAVNPDAFALFLHARQLERQFTPESFEQAAALLRQSLAIDPNYAAASVTLARIYMNQVGLGSRPREEGLRLARRSVSDALAADPDFALAHASLGRMAMVFDGDLATAARHYEHALTLDSTDTETIVLAARVALHLERTALAIELLEHAAARDPINTTAHFYLGLVQVGAGHFDAAIASARRALELAPERIGAHYLIGVALLLRGEAQAALAEMQQEPEGSWRTIGLTMAYHALGRTAESDATLAEAIDRYATTGAYNIAYALAWRNEPDAVFDWLDRAVAAKDPGLAGIAAERLFANVRDDPRWASFLRTIGKAPDQLATIRFDVQLAQQQRRVPESPELDTPLE
jgi:TolB-like protein/Tfp pilus assembly protein PilF